ncbi:MAG: ABC transporter substrate-binding protein [Bdellovibrionota bacterium]
MKKKTTILFYTILFALILFFVFFLLRDVGLKSHPVIEKEKLTKVVLGTDWFAQAEHGGFYQAIADGSYKKYGLDVQIKMGGPQVSGMNLLLSHDIDFFIPPSFIMLMAAQKKLPVISVGAVFQKDLEILMAHPNVGNDSLEALKGKPIFISASTAASVFGFLAGKYGYSEDQKRPYANSLALFLNDKNAIQEGLLTSEPFTVEKQGHFKPVTLLLSNYGFSAYGELITCRKDFEQQNSKTVEAFVKGSQEGWSHYLKNPVLGNVLIKKDNPQMDNDLLAYAVKKLNDEKIILGGDAQNLGLFAMTDKRWSDFYQMLVQNKSIEPGIDIKAVYTLKYIMKIP